MPAANCTTTGTRLKWNETKRTMNEIQLNRVIFLKIRVSSMPAANHTTIGTRLKWNETKGTMKETRL